MKVKIEFNMFVFQLFLFFVGAFMVLASSDGYWHNATWVTYLGLIIGSVGILLQLIVSFINYLSKWK